MTETRGQKIERLKKLSRDDLVTIAIEAVHPRAVFRGGTFNEAEEREEVNAELQVEKLKKDFEAMRDIAATSRVELQVERERVKALEVEVLRWKDSHNERLAAFKAFRDGVGFVLERIKS